MAAPAESISGVISISVSFAGLSATIYSCMLVRQPDNSRDCRAFRDRAYEYKSKGQLDRAIADYSSSIQLNCDDASLYKSLGELHMIQNSYDVAISDFTKAIRLGSEDGYSNLEFFIDRGIAYLAAGQFDLAIQDFNAALGIPGARKAPLLFRRAVAFAKKGDREQAIRDFKAARLAEPTIDEEMSIGEMGYRLEPPAGY
jgi:tetratricopeptide (TPR) repeat protein